MSVFEDKLPPGKNCFLFPEQSSKVHKTTVSKHSGMWINSVLVTCSHMSSFVLYNRNYQWHSSGKNSWSLFNSTIPFKFYFVLPLMHRQLAFWSGVSNWSLLHLENILCAWPFIHEVSSISHILPIAHNRIACLGWLHSEPWHWHECLSEQQSHNYGKNLPSSEEYFRVGVH